eukprot:2965608-Prymnesium_polylepis.4
MRNVRRSEWRSMCSCRLAYERRHEPRDVSSPLSHSASRGIAAVASDEGSNADERSERAVVLASGATCENPSADFPSAGIGTTAGATLHDEVRLCSTAAVVADEPPPELRRRAS